MRFCCDTRVGYVGRTGYLGLVFSFRLRVVGSVWMGWIVALRSGGGAVSVEKEMRR